MVVADQWFASSKTCSACGHKMAEMPLKVRRWQCPYCQVEHDRDINAAINLKNMAVSSTVSACGEESSGSARRKARGVKQASVKQEVNSNPTPQVG